MAYVDIEGIIDHLDSDIKRVLEDALKNYGIKEPIDRNQLFREFKRSVGRKCSNQEHVPDHLVNK